MKQKVSSIINFSLHKIESFIENADHIDHQVGIFGKKIITTLYEEYTKFLPYARNCCKNKINKNLLYALSVHAKAHCWTGVV